MRFLNYPQLKPEKGIVYSRVHLMRKVAAGEFPAPIPISDRRIAWLESEIDAWMSERASLRTAKAA